MSKTTLYQFLSQNYPRRVHFIPSLHSEDGELLLIDAIYEKVPFLDILSSMYGTYAESAHFGGATLRRLSCHECHRQWGCFAPGASHDAECSTDLRDILKKNDDGSWERPLSKSDIGELFLVDIQDGYEYSPARLIDVDPDLTVTMDIMVMLKDNGTDNPVSCVIAVPGGQHLDDCSSELAAKLPKDASGNPVDIRTFNRSVLRPLRSGVWCPLKRGRFDGVQATGQKVYAYGMNYAFNHNQDDFYANPDVQPPYTEFIEVSYKEDVYPVGVVIGCTRGCYAVVSIKAMYNDSWVSIYTGKADPDADSERRSFQLYHHFEPDTCHQPFKTRYLRIEMDTTVETGVGDWNYIDYIQLRGTRQLQPSVLRAGQSSIFYVPDEHAEGEDSFEYRVTDCLGTRFVLVLLAQRKSA